MNHVMKDFSNSHNFILEIFYFIEQLMIKIIILWYLFFFFILFFFIFFSRILEESRERRLTVARFLLFFRGQLVLSFTLFLSQTKCTNEKSNYLHIMKRLFVYLDDICDKHFFFSILSFFIFKVIFVQINMSRGLCVSTLLENNQIKWYLVLINVMCFTFSGIFFYI